MKYYVVVEDFQQKLACYQGDRSRLNEAEAKDCAAALARDGRKCSIFVEVLRVVPSAPTFTEVK